MVDFSAGTALEVGPAAWKVILNLKEERGEIEKKKEKLLVKLHFFSHIRIYNWICRLFMGC